MTCPKCNLAEHEQDALFCDKCGASLTAMACKNCNTTDHRPGTRFCRHCGASLTVLECPQCHATGHVPGSFFCDQCGSSLGLAPTSTEDGDPEEEQQEPHHLTDNTPAGVVAVDLGLPSGTKWASCNVGATKPEEYGTYFAWGETEGKASYTRDNHAHYDGLSKSYRDLGKSISGTEYDAARAKWGEAWRIPTCEQIRELHRHCEREWTVINGVAGHMFIGPNGNSIFLPAAGYRYGTVLSNAGSRGDYWSSDPWYTDYADSLNFLSGRIGTYNYSRYYGFTVRPVSR